MYNEKISFFNFSLKKLLSTETDHFIQAKIKIIYTVLVFSLLKAFLISLLFFGYLDINQIIGGVILSNFYLVLIKLFLAKKLNVSQIGHFLLSLGILIVYTNIFLFSKNVNIISLQFLFQFLFVVFSIWTKIWNLLFFNRKYSNCFKITTLTLNFAESGTTNSTLALPFFQIILILNFITIIIFINLFCNSFINNIKEKELLNQQLIIANRDANIAAQSKIDILSTIYHELRTPLNSVIGITDLLLDHPYNEDQKDNIKSLKFSAVSLHALVNDILDFNELGSEKIKLEKVSFNLFQVVKDICSGFIY
jgi:signal transduction histidine kinase